MVGKSAYDFPDDLGALLDSTAWNTTTDLPMIGPANDAQWQQLKVRSLGSTISIVYRSAGDQLVLQSVPTAVQQLSILYSSRAWVKTTDNTYADAPVSDGDTVLLDPEMMVAAVQYGFMGAKGFDTTAISGMLDKMIEAAIDSDEDAPTLSLSPSGAYPLLTQGFNLPDTGYGR